VVGLSAGSAERVHAVLVVDAGANLEDITRQANARLAEHQRVRTASTWPGEHLPRTDGTGKLKRVEIRRWARGELRSVVAAHEEDAVEALIGRLSHGRRVSAATSLEELGLSSLERVELMVALEQRLQTTVDEGAFSSAKTVGDLQALVDTGADEQSVQPHQVIAFPTWNRRWPARASRRLLQALLVFPLTRFFARTTVHGLEHLDRLPGPVIFASNHLSHMDTPVILAVLPPGIRRRVAPAMAKEFFKAHFFPSQYTWREGRVSSLLYYLAALAFNAFPLPQREAGARDTLRYIGGLASAGFSILIFPEGARGETGRLQSFRPGIGMIGSRLGMPVVPVKLEGVDRVLHTSWRMARRGRVSVRIGAPVTLSGDDYAAQAAVVEEAVRQL
jgi:long-chain acyl-CoA synthetase